MKNTPTPYSPYCARSFIKNIPRSVIQQVYRVSIPRNLNRRKRKRKKESQRTRANAEKPRKNRIFLSLLSIVVQTMQNLFYARLKKRGGRQGNCSPRPNLVTRLHLACAGKQGEMEDRQMFEMVYNNG